MAIEWCDTLLGFDATLFDDMDLQKEINKIHQSKSTHRIMECEVIETTIQHLDDSESASHSGGDEDTKEIISNDTTRNHVNYRKRKKEEMTRLRGEIEVLQKQIDTLQQAKDKEAATAQLSPWEKLARAQHSRRQEVLLENSKLKLAVQEQSRFAKTLYNLIAKRPRLAIAQDTERDSWKLFKLGKEEQSRADALHHIANREYENAVGSFIEAGLWDETQIIHDIKVSKSGFLASEQLAVEAIRHQKYKIPRNTLATMVWCLISGEVNVDIYNANYKVGLNFSFLWHLTFRMLIFLFLCFIRDSKFWTKILCIARHSVYTINLFMPNLL